MGLTWNSGGDPASGDVYVEVSGTITYTDSDVKWAYIDWDDGEDNSLDKAINQWEMLDTDSNSVTLTHTYTKAGTFTPVLRTINSQGIVSKYLYRTGTDNNIPEPKEVVAPSNSIDKITISDGDPTAVMRIENKQVLSGIDNGILEQEGPKDLCIVVPPLLSDTEKARITQTCNLEITGVMDAITYQDNLPAGTWNDFDYGVQKTVVTKSFDVDIAATSPSSSPGTGTFFPVSGGAFSKILEVKWTTPKMISTNKTDVNNFNKLKVFLIAQSIYGQWYPITYVSNGDPIKSIDDVKRSVVLDFSQSRAKASNKSISYYRYDNGKVDWSSPLLVNGGLNWQQSDATKFSDNTKTDESILKEGYTYYTRPAGLLGSGSVGIGGKSTVAFSSGNAWSYGAGTDDQAFVRDQFPLNEFNQFYDQYSLTRLEAVSDSTKYSGLDTFESVYRIRPVLIPTGSEGYFITNPGSSLASDETSIHTSGAWYNGADELHPSGTNMTNWNVGPFKDTTGATRDASEYWMLSNDVKFGKVFFNNTLYSPEMESNLAYNSGSNIAGVYYLRVTNELYGDKTTQKAEWVPLKFEDYTKIEKEYRDSDNSTYVTKSNTMSRSGYIEFDIPDDWYNVTHVSGLTGGFFDNTTDVKGTTSDWSLAVVANRGANDHVSAPFTTFALTGATGITEAQGDNIGKFKYIFHINTASYGGDQGKVFWVASGSNSKLFLASGTDVSSLIETTAGNQITGYLRRINIYDVFDGASKTSDRGTVPGYRDTSMSSTPWDYTFMFASGSGAGQKMATDVKNNFRGYPLKIVITGANNHFISGNTQPGVQPWNMFPITKSNNQIIVQKDNTAYDLSYLEITSDVAVAYAGTYYQAITKGGKVFITRTGTPIQNINFGGTALGDESQFKFNDDFTSYGTLRLLKRMQSESVRVMWDEVQKDGTYVRFFGYVTTVTQSHGVDGPRAPVAFSFNMAIEEICLIDAAGVLMSGVIPLGGIKDAANFK